MNDMERDLERRLGSDDEGRLAAGDTGEWRLEDPAEAASVVRHEEELAVEKEPYEAGAVRAYKYVDTERVDAVIPRDVEYADVERVTPGERDSGKVETLPDGSVSVPILEEELVVTKRTVVRERVIIRKHTITESHRIEADLQRERLDLVADPNVTVEDES